MGSPYAYTRIRYTAGGDYKRTERQRDILLKVFEKTKTLDHDDKLKMILSLLPAITTSYQDKLLLAEALTNYDIVGQKTFPDKFWGGKLSDGIWYAVPVSLKGNVKKLHKFLYPEEKYHPSETVKERSDVISGYADQANEDLPNDPSLNETENGEF